MKTRRGSGSGAARERLLTAWTEIRENLGRSVLQALGIMLGVASVLGGFSISDSQRQRAHEMFVKLGGLDKLNAMPATAVRDGAPTALAAANLGLRNADALGGGEIGDTAVESISTVRGTRQRVRSATTDMERQVNGIGGDYLAADGYEVAEGRALSRHDLETAAAVAVLGGEAARTFFPDGTGLGRTLRVGDVPVKVVGVLRERVFRFRDGGRNVFRRRNRIIALPITLVQRRMQGDPHERIDRVTFRVPELSAMSGFARKLESLLVANHRLQRDFRLDDVAARIRRDQSQGDVYNVIFMLSGVLALLGGGMVNVNIQLASLRDRVQEVGVKMAIGASSAEVFKGFMTEAMLLTALGSVAGLGLGVAFSKVITSIIGVPLAMSPMSFVWAWGLAFAFGLVFALYPAYKASRLSPMEALRYE